MLFGNQQLQDGSNDTMAEGGDKEEHKYGKSS